MKISPFIPGTVVCILLLSLTSVHGQQVVTSTADAGAGTLRQAVLDAVSGDTITFTNTLSGSTILLSGTQIQLNKSLTIDGSSLSNGITIDANANSRHFEVLSGTTNYFISLVLTNGAESGSSFGGAVHIQLGAYVSISNCTIVGNLGASFTGGGGGIYNNGTLDMANSVIKENEGATVSGEGGGIFNASLGTAILTDCILSDNVSHPSGGSGGAIFDQNEVTLINCVVSNNAASQGGAVYGSSLTASNSVFIDNEGMSGGAIFGGALSFISDCLFVSNSAGSGGAIYLSGDGTVSHCTFIENAATDSGGGIHNNGSAAIRSSTFTVNTAGNEGGAFYQSSGTADLNGATIVSNSAISTGGGIQYAGGTLNVTNSIVVDNSAASGPNIAGGTPNTSHNLLEGDPLLFPLGYYGGDLPTMPPQLGSPAIDTGLTSATNSPTDQRGFARVLSAGLAAPAVDIGACEFNGWLLGVDLTALETNLLYIPSGSVYDSATVFPPQIDPVALGLMKFQTQSEISALIGQGEANVTNDPTAYGLYTSNALLDLAVGDIGIEITGTNANLSLQMEQSDDLNIWTNAGSPVLWSLPVDDDKKFYRVRANP